MSTSAALVAVLVVAVSTYLMRASLIVLLAGVTIPPSVERALRYVGPATLAALAMNLAFGGEDGLHIHWIELVALLVAGAVVVWRRQLVVSMVVAMITLWLLTWLA
ncbi:MAG TPA: AzlD domain-containing protein [Ilumatobacter sp.]|nr:AzlD domain-containing protein [Ilumatobacter sp.]